MIRHLSLSVCIIFLCSCSFRSGQFELIKGLIVSNQNEGPTKNWTAYWTDKQIDLYAINFEGQIIFADEEINIFFKDKQIYKVTGLLPNNSDLDIKITAKNVTYNMDGKQIRVDSCEIAQTLKMDNSGENYSQSCTSDQSGRTYQNQIITNPEGFIISLQFKIHPDYPSLQLRIK